MNAERRIAMTLLNAVWNEDIQKVKDALDMGADPSWCFNGYPILIHALYTENVQIMELLIDAGATQTQEAFGYALEKGIGKVVRPLLFRGIIPKHYEPKAGTGDFPQRFAY